MNPSLSRFAALALACSLCASTVAAQATPPAAPPTPVHNAQVAPVPPKPAPVPNAQIVQPRPAPAPIPPPLAVPASPADAGTQAPAPAPAPEAAPAPAPGAAPAAAPVPAPQTVPPPPAVQLPPPGYPPPGYDPRYGSYPAHEAQPPRLSKGLMITGISILGGAYATSMLLGLAAADADNCSDCDDVGPPLFIPVFGPFIAAGEADDDGELFAFLGVAQLVGAGLMIGGIIKYKNSKKRAEQQGYVVELPRGKALALGVAASPRLMGPRLQLSF